MKEKKLKMFVLFFGYPAYPTKIMQIEAMMCINNYIHIIANQINFSFLIFEELIWKIHYPKYLILYHYLES